ncbi:VWA domain-containing protein [Streptomyces vilmorinianum]|uniref:VWA domain-containing protein n=1 Tax=Streptomyces vilmorinianum TaxID=3051092 RepID=UPI0010FB0BF9|nr:VWA domain-containing protein [Streptomyces vilmorinianum]
MFNLFKKPRPAPTDVAASPAPNLTDVNSTMASLVKTAGHSLEKEGLAGTRAAVYLVIDRSYSMHSHFGNGSVQHLADQALGLSVNLDDDGIVPLVFFDSKPYPIAEISLTRYAGVVGHQHSLHGGIVTMGGTQYAIAMRAVIEHYQDYQRRGGTDPALVIFQTDGDPQDRDAARLQLAHASALPLYWSFIGFGKTPIPFLQRLDDMGGRVVDNATYFHAGERPTGVSDAELYDQLLRDFGPWMAAARAKGVL